MSRVHLPMVNPRSSLNADGSRVDVEPGDVRGRFHIARHLTFIVLIVIYVVLPILKIAGKPAILLDIPHRQFYLFGQSYNAQDTWLLFFLLTGMVFGLLALTAVAGRIWCGWACPQTVFLDGVYRRAERLIEGSREKRLKRNAGPWNADKIIRKVLVWIAYIFISFLLAHVFLSYFVALPQLFLMMGSIPTKNIEAFIWVVAITVLLTVNFGWFREQLCLVVCPYGRLQSSLLDYDSLVVGYDIKRGEPRGKATDKQAGDCVDCNRCVTVCPTGIDIRNGLQMDCVACTACIDACDEVMDKLKRPRGLVRYDSQRGLAEGKRVFLRPRLAFYAVLAVLGLTVATISIRSRTDFEAKILRTAGNPFTVETGAVRNDYIAHIVNKRAERAVFQFFPPSEEGVDFVLPSGNLTLEAMGDTRLPFAVRVRNAQATDRAFQLRIQSTSGQRTSERSIRVQFVSPGPAALR